MLNRDLRAWRETARITQADAARAMGCTSAFLCRLEGGKVRPNVLHVARLARLYDVPPDVVGRALLRIPEAAAKQGAA